MRPMSSEPVRRIGLGSSSGHDPKRTGSPYHEHDRSESRKLERKIEKKNRVADLERFDYSAIKQKTKNRPRRPAIQLKVKTILNGPKPC